MIYLYKILPIFFLPIGLTIMLVVSGIVLRRAALCWSGITVLWLASTPLVSNGVMRVAEDWQISQPVSTVPKAQAIVVLSTGRFPSPGDSNESEWTDADRFYGGIELFRANKAPLLIFTGGWSPLRPNEKPEGEILTGYAADLGVPRDRILTTSKVTNTEEESLAVAALLAKRSDGNTPSRILLVTSAFHMRRAELLFVRAGLRPVAFPVDFKASAGGGFSVLGLLPNGGSLSRSDTALRELYGLAFYSFFRTASALHD